MWCVSLPTFLFAQGPQPNVPPGPLGQYVNPFIGTGGISYLCANNHPGAGVPFGMVRLSPDTVSRGGKRATNMSGYYYGDPLILGFSHTRLVGTGAVDGGNLLVIPCTAKNVAGIVAAERKGMNAAYSHENETAFPGYYGVSLPKRGITAELSATRHAGVHRYTFTGDQKPHLVIDVGSVLGKGRCENGSVRVLSESHEVEGSVETFGSFSSRYGGLKYYFVARTDQGFDEFGTWSGTEFTRGRAEGAGNAVGVDLGFPTVTTQETGAKPTTITLKVGISCVSLANARENLNAEAGDLTFDQVLQQAIEQWEEKLGCIHIDGGTDDQRTIFRTALYRSFQMPTAFSDVNGDYTGFDKQTHRAEGFTYYTDMSMWDTFRTVHPLYNLIARTEQRDMIQSLLKMGEYGGYLPRWPSGAGYTNSMFGTPADIMISEAYQKGIHNFDAEQAYSLMKKTALGPTPAGSKFSGRHGVEHYLTHQYCPSDLMEKSVASTVEYCYSDQAIARLAAALGHKEEAELFSQHGTFYRNLWNPQTQFFHPRNAAGVFVEEFQPELLTYLDFSGKFTHAYVEGSAWQWRWGVPADADAVVGLFKSRDYFVAQLEEFFEKAPKGVSVTPNAFYWQGNQPDIYAAYLFNHAGRPDLTQKWTRWILENKHNTEPTGLDGNDDGGTLSAWYVLSSLGLFPTAGTDRYELTSPLWDRSEIDIAGKKLTILAEGADKLPCIRKVWLNDQPVDRHWLTHAEIAEGGTLRYEMSAEPMRTDTK
jgi:predicted alpha-1,2-mannosidase